MVDENPGLVEEGPVGGEFVLEDEPVPVLVGTDLGVGGRVPLARLGLHQESLDDDVLERRQSWILIKTMILIFWVITKGDPVLN